MKTRVVNLRFDSCTVRADRRTILGNPFRIGVDGTREEVVAKHRDWFPTQPKIISFLESLRLRPGPIIFGCWCAPEFCHCDNYGEYLDDEGD